MTIAGTDLADTPAAAGLRAAKRVVIKVGSALLVDETTGRLRDAWLRSLADDIARMRARGQEVIVQGQEAKRMYMVVAGELAVLREVQTSPGDVTRRQTMQVATLGPRDVFGEYGARL